MSADLDWMYDAACYGTDPEIFFPTEGQSAAPALKICRRCPVIDECKDYAVTAPVAWPGIFGGTTERERREMRCELGLGADLDVA